VQKKEEGVEGGTVAVPAAEAEAPKKKKSPWSEHTTPEGVKYYYNKVWWCCGGLVVA
jgi:hypothetical protein